MGKKKLKKSRIAGFKLPKPVVKALRRFLETPFGREVAAAALAAAAQTLVTRYPMAATVSAGSGIAGAAKTAAGHAVEQVAHVLHGASDRLRHGLTGHDEEEDGDHDRADAEHGDGGEEKRRRRNGKSKGGHPADAIFADVSAKEIRRLIKAARRLH
jgi:hypothetical protein